MIRTADYVVMRRALNRIVGRVIAIYHPHVWVRWATGHRAGYEADQLRRVCEACQRSLQLDRCPDYELCEECRVG